MFCANCGIEIADDTNFCPKCGHSTKPQNAPKAKKKNTKLILLMIGIILLVLVGVIVGSHLMNDEKEKDSDSSKPVSASTVEDRESDMDHVESTDVPTAVPTEAPTVEPTAEPTATPTPEPTTTPTVEPTKEPSVQVIDFDFEADTDKIIKDSQRTNVVIFLVDNFSNENLIDKCRSDGIIVLSFDNGFDNSTDVRAVYVSQDALLEYAEGAYGKANSAYAKGGASQAIGMLNANLDLDLYHFMTIGVQGIEKIVDYLGGIVVDADENGLSAVNFITDEALKLTDVGANKLNGEQAALYCLNDINLLSKNSTDTMLRQIQVMNGISEGVSEVVKDTVEEEFINMISDNIYTNLSYDEVIQVLTAYKDLNDQIEFPYKDLRVFQALGPAGACMCPTDLVQNVSFLHYYLYGVENYQPHETVKKYSEEIDKMMEKYKGR